MRLWATYRAGKSADKAISLGIRSPFAESTGSIAGRRIHAQS
jgi:hypothetical protein